MCEFGMDGAMALELKAGVWLDLNILINLQKVFVFFVSAAAAAAASGVAAASVVACLSLAAAALLIAASCFRLRAATFFTCSAL